MGYIKHNALIVTGWDYSEIKDAHEKANVLFIHHFRNDLSLPNVTQLITPIVSGLANEQYSFMIAPDGSKEGWGASDNSDNARTDFIKWMKETGRYYDFVEVRFGGDDDHEYITYSNNK